MSEINTEQCYRLVSELVQDDLIYLINNESACHWHSWVQWNVMRSSGGALITAGEVIAPELDSPVSPNAFINGGLVVLQAIDNNNSVLSDDLDEHVDKLVPAYDSHKVSCNWSPNNILGQGLNGLCASGLSEPLDKLSDVWYADESSHPYFGMGAGWILNLTVACALNKLSTNQKR